MSNTTIQDASLKGVSNIQNATLTGTTNLQGVVSSTNDITVNGVLIGQSPSVNGNTRVGVNALNDSGFGSYSCTAFGYATLGKNQSGNNNTAIGGFSGRDVLSGSSNTFAGSAAGMEVTTGSNNVFIGANSGLFNSPTGTITTQSNQICIGNNSNTNAFVKVAWTIGSDKRDKTNLKEIQHGLEFVEKLKPTSYQYKKNRDTEDTEIDSKIRYGFLAQDILELEGSNPVIIDDTNKEYLKLNETALIPILVNAIKELSKKINELEEKTK
jgi:hypothetical protein